MKQLNHIAVKRRLTSTIWKQTVLVLLSILLILIAGGRLQAQTVIDATLATTIQTALNSGSNYTVTSSLDIIVSSAITKSANSEATLTLNAARDIFINADIISKSDKLNIVINSGTGGTGAITLASNLTTNGGYLEFQDGLIVNGTAAQSISSSGSYIKFSGEVILSNTYGLTVNSSDGNITFESLINSGNSYRYESTLVTWADAYTAYHSTIDYLATVTSQLELTAVMAKAPSNGAWIGGSDQGAEGTWKWVTGPEVGTIFWKSGTNATGLTGYSGYNGSFVNWNSKEPNDSGYNEDALQITDANSLGKWNDLPTSSSTLGSIVETEVLPSPLIIDAGSGTVTFNGAVGKTKALKSLTVTAVTTAINGGSVTTNGSGAGNQSYSGNIALGSASTTLNMLNTPTDFVLAIGKSISNATSAEASLTIKTTANIVLETNSSIASSVGKLNTLLWSDSDANGGAIFVKAGASITSNGGDVTLSGGTDYTTGYARGTSATVWSGVRIDGSINSGTGSVLLRGQIGDIPANQNTLSPGGVFIVPSGSVTATSGNITLAGYVGTNVGSGNALRAIRLGDGIASGSNQASITSTSGNISLTGTTIPTNSGAGILFDSSKIQSSSGSITLTGQRGGGEPDLLFNSGTTSKNISNQISSTTGNITMNANSLEVWGEGDLYSRLPISSAGQLTIQPRTAGTTIGLGGGAGSLSLAADLVTKSFKNGFSSVTIGSASAGDITVSGATTYSDPLTFKAAGNIFVSTGASLTGAAAGSDGIKSSLIFWADADANSIGGVWFQPSSSFTTNGGQIYIGGGTDGNSDQLPDGYAYGTYDFIRPFNGTDYDKGSGILIEGNLNSGGGDITAWGFAPLSISHSAGVHIAHSGVVNAGGGNILLNGQSDKGAAYIRGVWIGDGVTSASSAVVGTTGTGTLTITGQSVISEDILLDVSALSTENGNISIDGNDYLFLNAGTTTTNTITSGIGKVQIVSDAIIIIAGTNTIRSNGELVISPKTSSRPISLGTNVENSLNLPSTFFTNNFLDGFSQITVGSASQTGNITSTSLTFRDNMRLQTASPAKVVVTANNTLTLNAGVKLTIDKELELQTGAKIIK